MGERWQGSGMNLHECTIQREWSESICQEKVGSISEIDLILLYQNKQLSKVERERMDTCRSQ